jgi:hypothetical protein
MILARPAKARSCPRITPLRLASAWQAQMNANTETEETTVSQAPKFESFENQMLYPLN